MRRVFLGVVVTTVLLLGTVQPASASVAGFSDVKGHEFYAAGVAWMRGEGLTTGVGGTAQYQPAGAINRAQMATFLWRLEGSPGGYGSHGFSDVPSSAYYDKAVRWLRSEGLTTGVGGSNRFAPLQGLSRAEMAAFLWRYAGSPQGHSAHGFADVPGGAYYDHAVRWLKAKKITTGYGGTNRFEPHLGLNRGEMAAFIWRYSGKPAPPGPGDSRNCSDFGSQQDAQSWFDLYYPHYGDVAKLDQDNNLVPCESLP